MRTKTAAQTTTSETPERMTQVTASREIGLKSVFLDFGPQTPGGYYFAPVTWTPGTSGTWKVKYSIQMTSCSDLQTGTKNVDVS